MLDWFFALTVPEQWETVRNWLATIGGLIALLIATNTYRRNVKNKREEHARLVYAKVSDRSQYTTGEIVPQPAADIASHVMRALVSVGEDGRGNRVTTADEPLLVFNVDVHNGSKELVSKVKIQVVRRRSEVLPATTFLRFVEPESTATVRIGIAYDDIEWARLEAWNPRILFRDSSRQWWRRLGGEPIERIHDDPENTTNSLEEQAEMRLKIAQLGVEPPQHVRVPFGARMHRLARLFWGKDPIP